MTTPDETLPVSVRRVVLVDARDDRRQLMRRVVEGDDDRAILVGEADTRAAALAVVDEQRADVVVIDVHMPVAEGLLTIAALRDSDPALGIVVCSFDLDPATVQRALDHGADTCLAKPVGLMEVHTALGALGDHDRPAGESSDRPLAVLCAPASVS
jgi:DNA-binding NarL/FixJ family response regulator